MAKAFNKIKEELTFKKMDLSNLEEILSLSENILQEMIEQGHPQYLLKREQNYYEDILNDENDIICGVFRDSELIAMSCYHNCRSKEEIDRKFPNSDCNFGKHSVGVFSSVCVAPEFRGLGILGSMNDFVQELENFDFSIATAKLNNLSSIRGFLKKGYIIIKSVKSPVDGATICLLVKNNKIDTDYEFLDYIGNDNLKEGLIEKHFIGYCNHKKELQIIKSKEIEKIIN
jgi:hypothetical protein